MRLALFPPFPATHHPPMTVLSMEVELKNSSRLLQDYFKTILQTNYNLFEVEGPYFHFDPATRPPGTVYLSYD